MDKVTYGTAENLREIENLTYQLKAMICGTKCKIKKKMDLKLNVRTQQ